MLALEYGYRVSPGCALAAEGTNAAVEASAARGIAEARRLLWRNGGALLLVTLASLSTYLVSLAFAPLIVLAVLLWVAVFVVDALRSRGRAPIAKLVLFPLSTEPWQAWPCRVEGVRGNPGSRTKLVYLMSPAQEVVRTFQTRMPEEARETLEDGMGVLWICGDLQAARAAGEHRVAMGTVKGDIVWAARPAHRADSNGPEPTSAFSRCVDDASSAEMGRLLER